MTGLWAWRWEEEETCVGCFDRASSHSLSLFLSLSFGTSLSEIVEKEEQE